MSERDVVTHDGAYEVEYTRFGFRWGPAVIERVCVDSRGGVHLYITGTDGDKPTGGDSAIMVYVSPKGHSVKASSAT